MAGHPARPPIARKRVEGVVASQIEAKRQKAERKLRSDG